MATSLPLTSTRGGSAHAPRAADRFRGGGAPEVFAFRKSDSFGGAAALASAARALLSRPATSLAALPLAATATAFGSDSMLPRVQQSRSRHAPLAAVVAAAGAAGMSAAEEQEAQRQLEEAVERAAATLDELLQQVLRECVAEQAASYLREGASTAADDDDNDDGWPSDDDGWPSDDTLDGIVRGAVAQRVEWLDDAFLVALDAYAQAIGARRQMAMTRGSGSGAGGDVNDNDAAAADDAKLLGVLELVRREVLTQVSSRLPATVQVLDAALREVEAPARLAVVERALGGGGGGLPGVSFDALASTAGQLVDDMEDAEAVPDRALLARLVLLREELRAMHARRAYFPTGAGEEEGQGGGVGSNANSNGGAAIFGFHRSNLPRACAAFAKELMAVGDGGRRAALLAKAFEEDWTGGAAGPAAALAKKQAAEDNNKSGGGGFGGTSSSTNKETRKEAPDVVRPGRFLATVHAMSDELGARLRRGDAPAGIGGNADAAAAAGVLRRLDDVRMEAVAVLDRMQRRGRGGSSR